MGLSLASFRARFPEFASADDTLVEACIGEALLSTPADVWGDKADASQGLLAAHLLALSPYGQNARMIAKDGTTTYGNRRAAMARALALGCRVT